jgi:hypothetical protein
MIIYPVNQTLFIHSLEVIREGKVEILNKSGRQINVVDISGENFSAINLDIPEGKYLIRVYTPEGKTEKEIIIKDIKN